MYKIAFKHRNYSQLINTDRITDRDAGDNIDIDLYLRRLCR